MKLVQGNLEHPVTDMPKELQNDPDAPLQWKHVDCWDNGFNRCLKGKFPVVR